MRPRSHPQSVQIRQQTADLRYPTPVKCVFYPQEGAVYLDFCQVHPQTWRLRVTTGCPFMSEASSAVDQSAKAKSRVTNGGTLYLDPDIDGRSGPARRFRDIITQLGRDLDPHGGYDSLSVAKQQIVRRVGALAVRCELMEAEMMKGNAFDVSAYNGASNTMRRLLQTIGLHNRASDTTPSLEDVIARKRAS